MIHSSPSEVFAELFSKSDKGKSGRQVASPTKENILPRTNKVGLPRFVRKRGEQLIPRVKFFAEGEKTICYIVFDGFRQPTPDSFEPNGDGRITVSMSIPFFQKSDKSKFWRIFQ